MASTPVRVLTQHNDKIRRRQGVLRDYVCGLARPYATGLYLFGRPDTAKTHTVRDVLEREVREIYASRRGT